MVAKIFMTKTTFHSPCFVCWFVCFFFFSIFSCVFSSLSYLVALVRLCLTGEMQRVAIVLSLGKPADIYLIDEPSAYLDSEQRIIAAKVIKRYAAPRRAGGEGRPQIGGGEGWADGRL